MKLDRDSGWLQEVRLRASPHFNDRPITSAIDLLVVHGITLPPGQFGGIYIDDLFLGQLDSDAHPFFATIAAVQVSAHALIDRQGALTQYVSFLQRAWHAGASHWQGRDNCNDFSIGVELEGCDEVPYTKAQYQTLAQLAQLLMDNFSGIMPQRIVGHSDIAPQRKTDPGPAFDWDYFRSLL
ncbi:MAG: 1,6-anhydro-N-acetylmuramyl-L-alanine amidase AmpD [Gammaproteobacteria bacterium]|nr:1,6-anhydro-N-acetylmuramyl-L-alanine amidase AmpD [Gammaproteobacteria bacterium]